MPESPDSGKPALAPLRGVREQLGMPLPADAPSSRGTKSERRGVIERDMESIVAYVKNRLGTKSKDLPPISEIRELVIHAIRSITP